ncbi:Arginine deiminase [BD1-7 clade bacterium]|uniref:Arginine deiminase n=1 Tax=BD1-7 clade bacterium TaxID=2029982 RepID=A0A5S9NUX7_9GAMM|nr:Arginine deiminase [BD1-7 clade bacterium]CAA0109780.1 Arginine deiminase [BD1-7 clade bacterium]
MHTSRCYVGSETGRLRRVILHRPGLDLERLTPSNREGLLFDDVLNVERAGKEHDYFAQTLRDEGVEVHLLRNLLADVLENSDARQWLLQQQCSAYFLGTKLADEVREYLLGMSALDMATYLICGLTRSELPGRSDSLVETVKGPYDFILPPLPNHLFTRDTSCWIFNGVSVNPMAKQARRRETANLRAIYNFHPLFSSQPFDFWYGNNDRKYEGATVEGGDVMIIGNGLVLIGLGERTTPQAVELLATALFQAGAARQVIAVKLPKARSSMHLDTVMTMLDRDCFTIFPEVMQSTECWRITQGSGNKSLKIESLGERLFDTLKDHLGVDRLRLIETGGDVFQQEREQWNDANNVLTIRPGVVVGYEHNARTVSRMREAGITVMTIPGSELGRGRGGARCMSCPFDRDDID